MQDFSSFFPIINFYIKDKNIKILDACAATGGKSFQLLSRGHTVVLKDKSSTRIKVLTSNLTRLKLYPKILNKDFTKFDINEISYGNEEKQRIVGAVRKLKAVVHGFFFPVGPLEAKNARHSGESIFSRGPWSGQKTNRTNKQTYTHKQTKRYNEQTKPNEPNKPNEGTTT